MISANPEAAAHRMCTGELVLSSCSSTQAREYRFLPTEILLADTIVPTLVSSPSSQSAYVTRFIWKGRLSDQPLSKFPSSVLANNGQADVYPPSTLTLLFGTKALQHDTVSENLF